jgi:hypothetical protein
MAEGILVMAHSCTDEIKCMPFRQNSSESFLIKVMVNPAADRQFDRKFIRSPPIEFGLRQRFSRLVETLVP